jgi:hypothetical protein
MNERIFTEAEINTILTAADEKLKARASEPVQFTLDLPNAVGLISQLQLAFRHPQNTGVTKQMTEQLVRQLIETVAPERDEIYQVLMMGFNPAYDEAAETPRTIGCRRCKASFPLVSAIVNGFCPNCLENICPACGCTNSAACSGGCFWLPSGICSTCGTGLIKGV